MFRLDTDRLLACFTLGDADLALTFAQMEGFVARGTTERCVWREDVVPVTFGRRDPAHGAVPFQIEPGVFAYRLRYMKRRDLIDRMTRSIAPTIPHALTPITGISGRLLDLVASDPGHTTAHYAAGVGIKAAAASGLLCSLRSRGRLTSTEQANDGRRRCTWSALDTATPASSVHTTKPRAGYATTAAS